VLTHYVARPMTGSHFKSNQAWLDFNSGVGHGVTST
jgi:hypothetical protein